MSLGVKQADMQRRTTALTSYRMHIMAEAASKKRNAAQKKSMHAPQTTQLTTSGKSKAIKDAAETVAKRVSGKASMKHSESRCLTQTEGSVSAGNSGIEITVQFTAYKRRRQPTLPSASVSETECSCAALSSTRQRKLEVRVQSALPTGGGPADGWTIADRVSAVEIASSKSNFTVQRSEAASEAQLLELLMAVDEADVEVASMEDVPTLREETQLPAVSENGSAWSPINQGLHELELISRRLGSAAVKRASESTVSDQMMRTRNYLIALRGFTDTALALVNRFCPGAETPTAAKPVRPEIRLSTSKQKKKRKRPPQLPPLASVPPSQSPPQPSASQIMLLESQTFSSQMVQPSDNGAASTAATTLEARPPCNLAAIGKRVATVKCREGPAWAGSEPLPASHWWEPSQQCGCMLLEPLQGYLVHRLHPPARYIGILHSGQHPTISQQAMALGTRALRFASANPVPRKLATAFLARSAEPQWLLARTLEVATLRLPPELHAVATRQPLFAPLLGVCALRRAPPAAVDDKSSHPLLLPGGRVCESSQRMRLATTVASTVPFGPVDILETTTVSETGEDSWTGLQDTVSCGDSLNMKTDKTGETVRSVSGSITMTFTPALCLRLSVLPMPPQHSARRVRPSLLVGGTGESLADSSLTWPPETKTATSATVPGFPILAAENAEFAAPSMINADFSDSTSVSYIVKSSLAFSAVNIASGDQPDPLQSEAKPSEPAAPSHQSAGASNCGGLPAASWKRLEKLQQQSVLNQ